MRIILSEGQVNIFNLAKNAGTSVDQIERFMRAISRYPRRWRSTCRVLEVDTTDENRRDANQRISSSLRTFRQELHPFRASFCCSLSMPDLRRIGELTMKFAVIARLR